MGYGMTVSMTVMTVSMTVMTAMGTLWAGRRISEFL
jgi:hypothetical protein